jgi:uncharacterized membrane protein
MFAVLAGILVFSVPHLYSMLAPAHRDQVLASWGESKFKGSFSLVMLLALGLMIYGYVQGSAMAGQLYQPVAGARHATILLALVGFVLIAASHGKGYIKYWVRHPMSWGLALWSGGHLLANGEVLVVYIFATFLVLAGLDIVLSTLRGKRPGHVPQVQSDIRVVVIGLGLFVVFAFGFHPYILGIPVLG